MSMQLAANLRRPFFIAAVALAVFVILIEVGATTWLPVIVESWAEGDVRTVGHAITSMALLDGLVLLTVGLMFASLVVPERVHGRVQGVVTLVASLLMLLGAVAMILIAVGLLILMVTLLTAAPFGTLVYFGKYAAFPTAAAASTLGLILALKMGYTGCLLAAHQRMLQNKGLVLLVLTALLANIIISFLHAIVPGFLVSITDALAAIVVGILAAVWCVVLLIGSLPSVIKALRLDRA